jgi:hypothetical protein
MSDDNAWERAYRWEPDPDLLFVGDAGVSLHEDARKSTDWVRTADGQHVPVCCGGSHINTPAGKAWYKAWEAERKRRPIPAPFARAFEEPAPEPVVTVEPTPEPEPEPADTWVDQFGIRRPKIPAEEGERLIARAWAILLRQRGRP